MIFTLQKRLEKKTKRLDIRLDLGTRNPMRNPEFILAGRPVELHTWFCKCQRLQTNKKKKSKNEHRHLLQLGESSPKMPFSPRGEQYFVRGSVTKKLPLRVSSTVGL